MMKMSVDGAKFEGLEALHGATPRTGVVNNNSEGVHSDLATSVPFSTLNKEADNWWKETRSILIGDDVLDRITGLGKTKWNNHGGSDSVTKQTTATSKRRSRTIPVDMAALMNYLSRQCIRGDAAKRGADMANFRREKLLTQYIASLLFRNYLLSFNHISQVLPI